MTEPSPSTTRAQHLAWCRQRALQYVDTGDLPSALASLGSDLNAHPATANHPEVQAGLLALMAGEMRTPDAMRGFITGFDKPSTLAEAWSRCEEAAPAGIPPEQRDIMQVMFYAGALALQELVSRDAFPGSVPNRRDTDRMHKAHGEMQTFLLGVGVRPPKPDASAAPDAQRQSGPV